MPAVRAMFCKFCRDAGRDDYTTHNVRGPGGKLTCKVLAQIVCQYCQEKGHTVGYCSDRIKKESADRKKEYRAKEKTYQVVTAPVAVSVALNPFAALDMCEEVVEQELEETDDELSSEYGVEEREYDEEDMENARNCDVDFSTIPLTWGKAPAWI